MERKKGKKKEECCWSLFSRLVLSGGGEATTQTLFLINKNVMEISYVVSAPKHFSATSGTASSFQPVYVHNENIFSNPVNNYCFPYGEVRGYPSLWSLRKPWLWSASLVIICWCTSELQDRMRTNTEETWTLIASLPAADEKRWCVEKGCCCDRVEPRVPRGWAGGWMHISPWGPRWLVALLAMQRVQQKWVSAFDSEILALLLASLWCQSSFAERRRFYGLSSNLYDFLLEARGWGVEGENKTQPSPGGPQPKPQELQVSQIACSQKMKGNQPHSFFRQ